MRPPLPTTTGVVDALRKLGSLESLASAEDGGASEKLGEDDGDAADLI
jgi:hypothetical protein